MIAISGALVFTVSAPAWSAQTRAQAPLAPQTMAAHARVATHVMVNVRTAKLGKYGEVLVDQSGLALYYDTADKAPKHWACTGACRTIWPPLVLKNGQTAPLHAKGITGLGTVRGPSGLQVTWHGRPLYTYIGDSKGTIRGQGIKGVWYVAQVKTAAATTYSGGSW